MFGVKLLSLVILVSAFSLGAHATCETDLDPKLKTSLPLKVTMEGPYGTQYSIPHAEVVHRLLPQLVRRGLFVKFLSKYGFYEYQDEFYFWDAVGLNNISSSLHASSHELDLQFENFRGEYFPDMLALEKLAKGIVLLSSEGDGTIAHDRYDNHMTGILAGGPLVNDYFVNLAKAVQLVRHELGDDAPETQDVIALVSRNWDLASAFMGIALERSFYEEELSTQLYYAYQSVFQLDTLNKVLDILSKKTEHRIVVDQIRINFPSIMINAEVLAAAAQYRARLIAHP